MLTNTTKKPKLLTEVSDRLRTEHKSPKTEEAYLYWINSYIQYTNQDKPLNAWEHPANFGKPEIENYLTHLATVRNLAASTQNQAFAAILYLYQNVLDQPLPFINAVRAKTPRRVPTVFSRDEAIAVIKAMKSPYSTMAMLLYGSGLRLSECVALRVKDIDFQRKQIVIRSGKGDKDRYTILVDNAIQPLQRQINIALSIHEQDLAEGHGQVFLPHALAEKYKNAATSNEWFWVFPSSNLAPDKFSGNLQRFHLHDTCLQRAVKAAIKKVGITKHASCHTFRHSFATHLLENGYQLPEIKDIMGHSDIAITEIYLHTMQRKENPLAW